MALVALMATASLAACDDGLGVDGPANVAVSFRSGDAVTSADLLAPAPAGSPLRVVTSVDDGVDDDGPSCADFELGPRLVALPLDGSPVQAFETSIAPGVYDELEFEIEHMDDDEDDLVRYEALRAEILALIPDWPAEASIYVAGTFQADGADPVEFRAFVDAEIEIELGLTPSLEVGDDGLGDRDLVVDVRPDLWFGDGQGGVMDLTAWDFDETGQVLELELEIEDGFIEVELND
jgi:hypothetical protein